MSPSEAQGSLCVQQMRVDQLPNGRHQPFYQILVDERDRPGTMVTYVAQVSFQNWWGKVGGGGGGQ